MTEKQKGWIQIGDEKIPVEDVCIHLDEYHEEFNHERQEKRRQIKKSTIQDLRNFLDALTRKEYTRAQIQANGDHTCKKCKNLISILQDVNGEIMHCGYNCKESSMRADDMNETRRCELYACK